MCLLNHPLAIDQKEDHSFILQSSFLDVPHRSEIGSLLCCALDAVLSLFLTGVAIRSAALSSARARALCVLFPIAQRALFQVCFIILLYSIFLVSYGLSLELLNSREVISLEIFPPNHLNLNIH